MRLNIQISQFNQLQNSIKDLENEKAGIESAIRRISAEPFLNREKGGSNLQRIAELEQKLIAKE